MPAPQLVFAACAPGLEPVLARELAGLGLDARPVAGGAEASGEDAVALACLASRVAETVLLRLYDGPPGGVARARAEALRRFGAGARVAVRREGARAVLSIDAAGAPLHRRGFRARIGAAPLRETLAAGLLLAAGYDGEQPFLDPMCGAGTIALEAFDLAARRAPGRARRFAFEGWPGDEARRAGAVRARLAAEERAPPCPIHASDVNAGALRLAAKNAAEAGAAIVLERCDAARARPPPGPGVLAVNPPYGARLAGDPAPAWRALDALLARLGGWRAAVLAPDRGLERLLAASPDDVLRVRNGGLACRLLTYRL